ncbi:MAG: hypothetical protein PHU49_04260 [Syntrophorhabdaceae bacterium]|nr:hypothetical protein [Syntrophorhabdaceae bacterium]MDD5243209.1 hypothetical protein [Syntrophorhabdaceae bacterium]
MKKNYIVKDNEIVISQAALDKTGKIIATRDTSIPLDDSENGPDQFFAWVESIDGADLSTSANKATDSILDSLKAARSPFEVKILGQQLNRSIELLKNIK